MITDIRLHGQACDGVEFFATVVGADVHRNHFFDFALEEGMLRIFSQNNQLVIGPAGVSHIGNGGCFCEYMFGVDHPTTDLLSVNRLLMYGTQVDETSGLITFSNQTSGGISYDSMFLNANAACNYFFFVCSGDLPVPLKNQQEELTRLMGRALKRSTAVGGELDDILVEQLFPLFKDPATRLFIVKFVHRRHREYRDLFKTLYFRNRKISDSDFASLVDLASTHRIQAYQAQRIRIHVMYHYPPNKRIVDEYLSILLNCNDTGKISPLDNARLTRLKALSMRNKIPSALFYKLDEILKDGQLSTVADELDYLSETKLILEGIFLREKKIENHIDREDIFKLIQAKKRAVENRDSSYDQLMLNTTKTFDEKIRDGADPGLQDDFSLIFTYLDRFDSTANLINTLAFMENAHISDEMLRGLLDHKSAFDSLKKNCFKELFINDLLKNAYLGRFGRRKIKTLMEGLEKIEARALPMEKFRQNLMEIDAEERIYLALLEHIRNHISSFYSCFGSKADQEALRRELTITLKNRKLIKSHIPDHIFNESVFTIKKEAVYLQSLLPEIISERNIGLREDFLENSGLDRFYVEELEREYYEKNGLDLVELYQIRKGLN